MKMIVGKIMFQVTRISRKFRKGGDEKGKETVCVYEIQKGMGKLKIKENV